MSKQVLVLDSHRLSAYQKCPREYFYTYNLSIRKSEAKRSFARGSWISRIMHVWNYWKYKGRNLSKIEQFLFKITITSQKTGLDDNDKLMLAGKLMLYFSKNRNNNYKIISTECGFSRILHEDNDLIVFYEGRPDLVYRLHSGEITVLDYKTWTVNTNLYEFNNQALGYCWGLNTRYFVYDFFGLIKDNDKCFIKKSYNFSQDQIDSWKNNTIEWSKKIVNDMQHLQSLNCRNIYGLCDYHEICEQPNEAMKQWLIKRDFVQVKPWRAWH